MTAEQIIILIASNAAAAAVCAAAVYFAARRSAEKTRAEIMKTLENSRAAMLKETGDQITRLSELLSRTQEQVGRSQNERLRELAESLKSGLGSLQTAVNALLTSLDERMKTMSEQNERRLEQMRATVDEKLQKTLEERLGQSFRQVSESLETVNRGLGEMRNLAAGVGDLKKVLSNVKTRGILGEVQLGAILSDILTPGQYRENYSTVPGSSERVEFAVRLPGADDSDVYIPIDSKFPGDTYAALRDAYEAGDRDRIEEAAAVLERTIKNEARDISEKYISPPDTTEFGIMFLPFEGLYAEVVNRGIFERIQREYRVVIAGPSTMAALLNSLQMGFRTLALKKRSAEVWRILGGVKTEFGKFAEVLEKARGNIRSADKNLEELVGRRTRAMNRKLDGVEKLDEAEAALALEEPGEPGPAEYAEDRDGESGLDL